jgi:hypothetical protein
MLKIPFPSLNENDHDSKFFLREIASWHQKKMGREIRYSLIFRFLPIGECDFANGALN